MRPVEALVTGQIAPQFEPRLGDQRRIRLPLDVAIPVSVLSLVSAACWLLPHVASIPDPVGGSVLDANLPLFSSGHVLGTDMNGNDTLARVLHGGGSSLQIALAVNLIGLIVGGLVGALAGYICGLLDAVIMRFLDVLIAFPSLVLVLAVAQGLGPGQGNTIWALSFFSVPAFARVARAATLRLRAQPFMTAAVLSGSETGRILLRHVAPNILPQLVSFGLLGMGIVIVIEGGMTFLGLGVRAPEPSWGNMIYDGQQALSTRPELVLIPGVVLSLTVLSFNRLGDALRIRWSRV